MLEVNLLGEQRVALDGTLIEELRSPRTLGVLAYLAVHEGAPQLRQHLAGVFWPDTSDAQARTNLRRELHRLRGALPDLDQWLVIDPTSVCWRAEAPGTVDVVVFQRAAAEAEAAAAAGDDAGFRIAADGAVRAYDGELLPAFYDDWVLAERERLHRVCITLLERLVATHTERGDTATALLHARHRVELEPLEEAGYRTVMTLEAETGDRAAALRTFHRCAAVLARELGIQPSPETLTVYEELVARSVAPVPAAPEWRADVPLVGRADELARLHGDWGQTTTQPHMVLVAGEAGVGKTRVAAEFAEAVDRGGGRVARARCFPSRGRLALAPVAEWLRAPGLHRDLSELDRESRVAVGRLLPELGAEADEGRPEPLADAWRRRHFFEGLASAVLAVPEATLLVLDDLQWCDGETLAWLEILLHATVDAPLLVLATLRSEELADHPDLAAWCRRLRAEGILRDLELTPLSADETADLVEMLRGLPLPREDRHRLQADTGGFPLLMVESSRHGPHRSARVDAVLAGRLAQLGPEADELVGLASTVGRDFSFELLAAAGDFDDATLIAAIDELWRRRLLREHSSTTFDFTHDLLRDAAYARLTPPHRKLWHRRVAVALEQLYGDRLESVAAELAEQWEQGGQAERAIRYHTIAADAATAVFALDDAVRHYDRALELLADVPPSSSRDRWELEVREALVPPLLARRGYAAPELGTTLARSAELGERLGQMSVALRSHGARWGHLFARGRVADSLALTERLMVRAADYPDQARQLGLASAGSLTSLGRPRDALARFAGIEEQVDAEGAFLYGFRFEIMARAWRAHALWLSGATSEAAASAAMAIELAAGTDRPFDRTIAQAYGAITRYLLGDLEGCGAVAAAVRELCDRYGFAYYGEWGRILAGRARGGPAGEAEIREGIDRLRAQHAGTRMPFWWSLLAEVLAETGRRQEASRVLGMARETAAAHGDRFWIAELWRLDGILHSDPVGRELLKQALEVAAGQRALALELRAAIDLARRYADAGDLRGAVRCLGPVRPRASGCNPDDVAAADALLEATSD
ncbi:SARP family transcriptional regulator [Egibacter rhizosphaerae]|uniref:SARP family transcriptional regulator n=1 Tax=Egibacter rhizosphaerae TaxID=1670831 RepID=A0A411YDK8_9ACTN|nr:BTAD domain-containing putative transcriptional regulator [Egibacter rhizosphaerae]QBI19303.1 SARP family transcriptional regulator [Egibacter rhizosphaerae]